MWTNHKGLILIPEDTHTGVHAYQVPKKAKPNVMRSNRFMSGHPSSRVTLTSWTTILPISKGYCKEYDNKVFGVLPGPGKHQLLLFSVSHYHYDVIAIVSLEHANGRKTVQQSKETI